MLNKQGPDKIDYCDYTWNPISGKCFHNCPYCYMHGFWRKYPAMALNQFKTFYLDDKFPKKPSKIFVGSSTDMWGDWVPGDWIEKVLKKIEENPQHIFLFLTKNPKRYMEWDWPDNAWYGTTVDGTKKTEDNIHDTLENVQTGHRFVSFEPLLKPVIEPDLFGFQWIIIGADSSRGAKKPPIEWAKHLIDFARRHGIAVWVKDNYNYPEVIKEFPKDFKNQKLL